MKYLAIMCLFLFFAFCLSGVKTAQTYSERYDICAANWVSAVNAVQSSPLLRAQLRETVKKNEGDTWDETACPKLTKAHKKVLLERLTQKTKSIFHLQIRARPSIMCENSQSCRAYLASSSKLSSAMLSHSNNRTPWQPPPPHGPRPPY